MCDLDQKNMMKNPKNDDIIGVHHRHLLLEDPTPQIFLPIRFANNLEVNSTNGATGDLFFLESW